MNSDFKPALSQSTVLNNKVNMPLLGLGVWESKDGDEVINAIKYAVRAGYRSIDTAAVYGNEKGVGVGIKECGVPREELFITTKVWNSDQGYEKTLKAFEESRKKLQLDYLDLYLIHWVKPETYRETWKALVHLNKEGYVRAIGVSNHQIHHLETLIDDTGVVPSINQVERHPMLSQKELIAFGEAHGIVTEAYSPLMRGNLDEPTISEIAKKKGKSPAQIILRWDLQQGVVVIPKSVHENRIIENSQIFDFELTDEEMNAMDALNQNHRLLADPDHVTF